MILLLSQNVLRSNLISKNFLGVHAHRPPKSCVLVCLYMRTYIHIRQPRNPPPKNPGYGPAVVMLRKATNVHVYNTLVCLSKPERTY